MVNLKNKVVLITGHTGFKGSWLVSWLLDLGAIVVGVSEAIPTTPSMFEALKLSEKIKDYRFCITETSKLSDLLDTYAPDYLFHLAAQPIVRDAYLDPAYTFLSNTYGTISVLDSLRSYDRPIKAVFITSDKVYQNNEWFWGYRENDALGGVDPYSASKAAAELAIRSYVASYFKSNGNITLAVARAGNVIGGGDWASSRIVPDCIRSWVNLEQVKIRNPSSTRPWQHVLEPIGGYLKLGSMLTPASVLHGEAFNFGPQPSQNADVLSLIERLSSYWASASWKIEASSDSSLRESSLLRLVCDKAESMLGWHPVLHLDETIDMTARWYKLFYEGNPKFLWAETVNQLRDYQTKIADFSQVKAD